jgi:DNA helicase-2/ATP-dependent DNA helicase PcrA
LTAHTPEDNLMFEGSIDAVFEHDDGVILVDYKTSKNTGAVSANKRQLAVYKKMYSQLENVPEEKIKTCVIFVALRGGINTGKTSSSAEYGTRDVFGTFEGHLQKVLAWKENPDEFIRELVGQDTRDTLHGVIKEKLKELLNHSIQN